MKSTFVCPHCSAELELDDIAPGTRFECPGCGGACVAPGADPPAPAPAPRPRQLRIPARRDTAPAPVAVTVQAPQRGIFATAFRGCGVLLVMAVLLVVAIVGCNALGLATLFSTASKTSPEAQKAAVELVAAAAAKDHLATQRAASALVAATSPETKPDEDDPPAWTAEISTDAMTDAHSILALLREDDPPRGLLDRPAFLGVRFDEASGISFALAGVSAMPGRVESQMRWDDAPAEPVAWSGGASGFLCLRDGRELYGRLRTSRRLRIRVDGIGGRRDAAFTLGGLDAALDKVDPARSIRKKADRLSKERGGWMTKRQDDGTVVLTKFGRDHWAGVAEGVSPIALMVALDASGRVGLVCIRTGTPVLSGGNWSTKIGPNPTTFERWRENDGAAIYDGDAVDLVRRLERARTLRVDVHAGVDHAEVEWHLDGLADALAAARRGVADL